MESYQYLYCEYFHMLLSQIPKALSKITEPVISSRVDISAWRSRDNLSGLHGSNIWWLNADLNVLPDHVWRCG